MNDDDTTGTPPPPATPAEQTVPYARFQQVVAGKADLAGQLKSANAQIQTLTEKAATADTVAAQAADWKAKAELAEGKFGRYQAISGALGTTDAEAIEAAEWAHGRLPAEGRPDLAPWLESIKSEPDTAPKVLAPWLTTTSDPPPPKTKTTPRPGSKGTQPPGASSSLSPAAVRAARDVAVQSGDWSQYKALVTAAGYRTNAK